MNELILQLYRLAKSIRPNSIVESFTVNVYSSEMHRGMFIASIKDCSAYGEGNTPIIAIENCISNLKLVIEQEESRKTKRDIKRDILKQRIQNRLIGVYGTAIPASYVSVDVIADIIEEYVNEKV